MLKTTLASSATLDRKWYLVDAQGQVLGRLASRIARLLMGKGKPLYTPHVDAGDFVIVINADKFRVTGKKLTDKVYHRHTFYPGGHKQRTMKQVLERHPERIIRDAVKCMLPKNRLQALRMRRLRLYVGSSHPHEAQRPIVLERLP
ncbi:MAG: 50S ribosomal protein L13 [candidate division WOR-3 bacterium]